MENLTKDQQQFWDLLRMPYKQNCHNCKHIGKGTGNFPLSWTCNNVAEECHPVSWDNSDPPYHRKWEWDGKTN